MYSVRPTYMSRASLSDDVGARRNLRLALFIAGFLSLICLALALRASLTAHVAVVAGTPGEATDALGISYASRLTNGTSASAHTRLFEDPADRGAQIQALREDDAYATGDPAYVVANAENKMLFSVCGPGSPVSSVVQCSGRSGFILHLALRGQASAGEQSVAIDRYGMRWAQIFERYHPRNHHCALVLLASDATAEDEADNDDAGNGIIAFKCFR